jgi:hypothetical protein
MIWIYCSEKARKNLTIELQTSLPLTAGHLGRWRLGGREAGNRGGGEEQGENAIEGQSPQGKSRFLMNGYTW